MQENAVLFFLSFLSAEITQVLQDFNLQIIISTSVQKEFMSLETSEV